MLALTPDLLAPGDGKSAALDPAGLSWTRIQSMEDPAFQTAYEALWAEFGAAHEMETRAVLAGRFALGAEMRYEMVLVRQGDEVAAVRDHTAIWMEGEVVVHLSHVMVMPLWRRSGLAGWMRAVPILLAREVATAHGRSDAPITLIGEMEYDDGTDARRSVRLLAYGRAGYRKVEPARVDYHQPDFREPAEIDAAGGPSPLPFQLIVRQVDKEREREVYGERVGRWIRALHSLYAAQFRPQDMRHPLLAPERLPDAAAILRLLPPTEPGVRIAEPPA